MRNDELVYVKVHPGRVVLERPMDAAPADRRRRAYGGGQEFITTRERAASLAVDIIAPVVAPAADAQPAEAAPVAPGDEGGPNEEPAPAADAGTGETDAAATDAPADGEGDEGGEAEQDPSKPRKRSQRGGHDRLLRGGHDRAI